MQVKFKNPIDGDYFFPQVSHAWPGLPAGVKFDPSDVQILEHLAAKCGVGESDPHMFIDEFIPTLDMENGICYTHPENLPGEIFLRLNTTAIESLLDTYFMYYID